MEKRKKIMICFCILITFIVVSSKPVYAEHYGIVTHWYSDSSKVSFFEDDIKIKYIPMNMYFPQGDNAYTNAVAKWNVVDYISITPVISGNQITFCSGTMSELKNYDSDFSGISSSDTGYMVGSSTLAGTITYQQSTTVTKYVYENIWSKGCVINKGGRTTIEYNKTGMHELGHCIGWNGHSSISSDVMYSYGSSVTDLTTRDKTHISQIYSLCTQ